jgi:hypothetical protein
MSPPGLCGRVSGWKMILAMTDGYGIPIIEYCRLNPPEAEKY